MLRVFCVALACVVWNPFGTDRVIGADAAPVQAGLIWHGDYSTALRTAEREGKMVLIYFPAAGADATCARFESETLAVPSVVEKLKAFVLLKVPVNAEVDAIEVGKKVLLHKHEAFCEMLGQPGIAILDYAHKGADYYGRVVSAFPMSDNCPYTVEQMGVIFDLPPGTLTQRTLIYAVRTHPERPASTQGALHQNLALEAESHSAYQARILRQGHHAWESRFHRISAQLPNGMMAKEVCAESWPGQRLLESAIECVRCWRQSSGHWSAVVAPHRFYGYDMKQGTNGVWYATGIFGVN